ncbi:translation initiation factor IF-2-like [Helicoverpa zea]|uniref:Cuticular protein CPH19 n=1 Tax=Helicoverpa armigera TaxID=29058 RepID=A0A0R7JPY2_HELAM|nr:translation initiation factor IF-2-like [Helicoverpa zea]AKQ00284.1 cuticular protein CPH19 [Helicoverpa armigera]
MFSFKSIVLIAAAFTIGAECSGVAVPAVAAAPLVAPAAVGYAHAVPQNIPPYAAQVSVVSKALNPVLAAPFAAPYAAAPYAAYAAGPYAAGPYLAGPAPVLPGPYAAGLAAPAAYAAGLPAPYAAAPYPYAASPLVRAAPFGYAPAYVR